MVIRIVCFCKLMSVNLYWNLYYVYCTFKIDIIYFHDELVDNTYVITF